MNNESKIAELENTICNLRIDLELARRMAEHLQNANEVLQIKLKLQTNRDHEVIHTD